MVSKEVIDEAGPKDTPRKTEEELISGSSSIIVLNSPQSGHLPIHFGD